MKNLDISSKIIAIAVLFFAASIIIAQLFTPSTYSWTQNTVSELAAQNYDNAWIMSIGLMGYGILLGLGIILRLKNTREFVFPDAMVFIYAVGIFLSGVFATAPFDGNTNYSMQEASLHSIFATAAGLSISIAMISYFFADKGFKRKLTHLALAVFVVGLSALFGLAEDGTVAIGKGLVQRSMYVFGLSWIVVNYNFYRLDISQTQ